MNIKKLIATVVIALGAWISVGVAQADTFYNFTFTGETLDVDGTPTSGMITGVFGVIADNTSASGYLINSISGTVSGWDSGNGSITGLLQPGVFENDNALYFPNGGVYLNNLGVSFTTSGNQFNISLPSFPDSGLYFAETGSTYEPNGTLTVTPIGAAPEMNASFIPQVALMLACLFFLLGRKKENTEAMHAA